MLLLLVVVLSELFSFWEKNIANGSRLKQNLGVKGLTGAFKKSVEIRSGRLVVVLSEVLT